MFQFPSLVSFFKRYYDYLILGVLLIFILSSTVLWLQIDNSLVENRDSTIFLSRVIEFIEKMGLPDFDLVDSLGQMSLGGRPILDQILSIPFLLIFGRSMDAFTYVNLLFYILLVFATYQTGKEAHSKFAGLLAAILVVFYPSTVRLSKIPLTNFSIIASAALTVWLVIRFMKTRSAKDVWLVNLSLAIGFWIHPSFLWGVSIPAALLQIYVVFFGENPRWVSQLKELPSWLMSKLRQPFVLRGVLPSAPVSIGVILMWYVPYGMHMFKIISRVDSYIPDGGKFFLGPNYPGLPYQFWLVASSGLALSTVLAVLFWVGLVALNVKRQPFALALTFIFFSSYVTHNMMLGLGWRYFSQALPVIASLTGIWIASLRNKFVSIFLALLCGVVSIFNFTTVSWGASAVSAPVAAALGSPDMFENTYCRPSYALYCPDPPDPEEWPIKDMLNLVFDDPKCHEGDCRLLVIPDNIYFYQAFPFSAAIDFPGQEINIVMLLDPGVWGVDVDAPFVYYDIPALLESDYIVYALSLPSDANSLSASAERDWVDVTYHFFNSPPALFSESHQVLGEFLLPDGSKAALYKRTRPLTLEEAEQAVSFLDLSDMEKIRKLELFLRLSEKEEDVNKWLAANKEALLQVSKPEPYLSLLIGLGDYYQSSGQTELAIASYKQALEMNPENLTVQLNLSRIYLDQIDYENAIPHLVEVARLQPSARRYANLGDVYRKSGQLENAINAFQKAIRKDPEDAFSHLGLGLSYAAYGNFEQARSELEKVIELSPNSSYASRAKDWLKANENKFK